MGKILRLVLYLVGGLVGLIVLAAIIVLSIVDPNDYRDDITALVQDSTGRALTIEGDLGLSVFPWLALEIGPTRLGNAPGFGDAPFAQVEQVQLRVRLLPLLRGELEMDTLVLDGLRLNLARNAGGVNNWDDLVPQAPAGEAGRQAGSAGEQAAALAGFAIGGIRISDAELVWDDRASGVRYVAAPLSLRTGAIEAGEPVDMELSVRFKGNEPPVEGGILFTTRARLSASLQQIAFEGTEFALDLSGEGVPGGELKARFTTEAALDIGRQTVELSKLAARFDESTLEGSIRVAGFDRPAVRFDVALDRLDLDRYLPPQAEGEAPVPATPTTAAAAGASVLPVDTLRRLDLDGTVRLGSLKAFRLHSEAVEVKLAAKGGRLSVHPARASLYGGSYNGNMQLDVRGSQPRISLNESLSKVQIGPLLKDLTGKDTLTGTAELQAQLSALGQTPGALKKTLNGRLSFAFTDGAVKGINLAAMVRKARARIRGEPLPADGGPNQTDFTELRGSATVTNGVVDNRDLLAKSPLLRVTGQGTVDLPREAVDYLLKAKVVGTLEGQGGRDITDLKGLVIPVQISGSFSQPVYTLRLDEALKQSAERKIRKKVDKHRQELERRMREKLKGLFN